ncbi:MAG: Na(+)-translocating NADH-quinone reductase subunit C (EC [uncultured Thiotrichaceae bacterium]|uniref:Na(+)-translocating NADH-quinone reductase subunit C n=1 Tax=uncultured Thiotrichaceae bacterium TaxID=298394 RepID=A0A6S6UBE6_9GAMM|nr:MAG: Na(+)-translocating NADH-quinone reductase subunit C (EC [uncultured Thiotrichaceae bacterium]
MIRRFLDMPNDSTQKTIFVAAVLCLVCSVLVSGAAVALKPIQNANKALDKKRNILQIAGLVQEGKTVDEMFSQVEPKVVDLATGEYVTDIDAATYDARAAAVDPKQNVVLTKEQDIASIKRRSKYATVYLARDAAGKVSKIILPVSGYGLWSTLHGFMALAEDASTITGFGFYEHAETPGLGGEVDNPAWKAQWSGKQLFDEQGNIAVDIVKSAAPDSPYQIDALSGATLTGNGVENLVHFWAGEDGFGPYLQKARSGGEL